MTVSDDAIKRLAEYWHRARVMHQLLHSVMEEYDRDLDEVHKKARMEFQTFLYYWLSGLFVVVEGFNKLKLKDERVQSLFKGHLRHLKAMRNETYHFSVVKTPEAAEVLSQMNWAEQLHAEIGEYLREYIHKLALEEEREEKAAKRKRRKKKKS